MNFLWKKWHQFLAVGAATTVQEQVAIQEQAATQQQAVSLHRFVSQRHHVAALPLRLLQEHPTNDFLPESKFWQIGGKTTKRRLDVVLLF